MQHKRTPCPRRAGTQPCERCRSSCFAGFTQTLPAHERACPDQKPGPQGSECVCFALAADHVSSIVYSAVGGRLCNLKAYINTACSHRTTHRVCPRHTNTHPRQTCARGHTQRLPDRNSPLYRHRDTGRCLATRPCTNS